MAERVLVNRNSLADIAAAIREKNGTADSFTPGEMGNAIRSITTGGGEGIGKMPELVDRSITEVRKEDLGDITAIGISAFYPCNLLTYVELPDTVTHISSNAFEQTTNLVDFHMSKNIQRLEGYSFSGSGVKNIYFYGALPSVDQYAFANLSRLEKIYVPSEYYDDYYMGSGFSTCRDKLVPMGAFVEKMPNKTVMVVGETKRIDIQCLNANSTPIVSGTATNNCVTCSWGFDAGYLHFNFNALQEGTSKLTFEIEIDGKTFIREIEVVVVTELTESSFEVVPVEGAEYGFELNADGYWESTNKGIDGSCAMCRINISNQAGLPVYIDCINCAELNYDYGILSEVDTTLENSPSEDATGVYHSFRGESSYDLQSIEYTIVGDGFITVKYIKDGSGAQDNDSLQFNVTIG